jgi:hypothetical protein
MSPASNLRAIKHSRTWASPALLTDLASDPSHRSGQFLRGTAEDFRVVPKAARPHASSRQRLVALTSRVVPPDII